MLKIERGSKLFFFFAKNAVVLVESDSCHGSPEVYHGGIAMPLTNPFSFSLTGRRVLKQLDLPLAKLGEFQTPSSADKPDLCFFGRSINSPKIELVRQEIMRGSEITTMWGGALDLRTLLCIHRTQAGGSVTVSLHEIN